MSVEINDCGDEKAGRLANGVGSRPAGQDRGSAVRDEDRTSPLDSPSSLERPATAQSQLVRAGGVRERADHSRNVMNYQVTREEERSLRNTIIKRAGKQEKQKRTLIQVEEVGWGGLPENKGGQGSQAAPTKPCPDPLTGHLSSHSCLKNKTKHHPPENFTVQRAHRTNER